MLLYTYKCVFSVHVCVSHLIQNVKGRCLSSKEHLDTLSKGRAAEQTQYTSELHFFYICTPCILLKDEA